ncbi:MBL fold metallo-hydrolase [Pseudalkalibacillus sp. R45]|uniref:MBL fold metallo-hydrolase n=1 Tax=Pseudalkalibacillus sp. R45 TaxID=3457433 RepID=UPI003FCC8056
MKIELENKHFTLQKIKDGVFAALAKQGGGAVANAGIIDLGDQTIIFDTFNTQQAAEELKTAAQDLTLSPITCVINSHWHGDHIRGNQVFEGIKIISSESTYSKMKELHPNRIKKKERF